MGSSDTVRSILAKRRDRMIATILSAKEDWCDEYLPSDVSADFRTEILDEVNNYFDLCCDLIAGLENENVVFNELYLKKLSDVHEVVVKG